MIASWPNLFLREATCPRLRDLQVHRLRLRAGRHLDEALAALPELRQRSLGDPQRRRLEE